MTSQHLVHWSLASLKRPFDLVAAAVGFALISPFLLAVAVAVVLDSPGGAIYRQRRIGRGGKPFMLLKFRTMVPDAERTGLPITCGEDHRITRVGRFLRKSKIDELPQLLNVVKGEMSLVGPRPEVPRYVNLFSRDFHEILQLRPGITDLASIQFRHEATLLGAAEDPEAEYINHILPEKIALAKEYIRRSSLGLDLFLIASTLFRLSGFGGRDDAPMVMQRKRKHDRRRSITTPLPAHPRHHLPS